MAKSQSRSKPAKPKSKRPTTKKRPPRKSATDPTSDEALLALPDDHAEAPDIPVDVAQRELSSLVRLAKSRAKQLEAVGVDAAMLTAASAMAAALKQRESAWQRSRKGVFLSSAERKRVAEAEKLRSTLVAGGRWACRSDGEAQAELTRITEGSGLADTVQDLGDLVAFWQGRTQEIRKTLIKAKDLGRATELARKLEPAAQRESADVDAALAQELRNRAFWAADALAKEIRECGRYAFQATPKLAAKFTSRYRASVVRRSKKKKKASAAAAAAGAAVIPTD